MKHGLRIMAWSVAAWSVSYSWAAPPVGTPPAAPAPPAAQAAPAPPAPEKVQRGPFRVELELSGILEAEKAAEIAFPGQAVPAARILKAVAPGTRVKKGEVVLWLDRTDIAPVVEAKAIALGLAQTALKQGQEELALLEKTSAESLMLAELAAARAGEDLDRWLKIERPLEEKNIAQALKAATMGLEYAREELRQLEKMYKADDLTEETEELILKRQKYAVESAEHHLVRVKIDCERKLLVDLPRQQQAATLLRDQKARDLAFARTVAPLGLQKKKLEVQKLTQDLAKAVEDEAKARRDLAAANLAAPIDGIVFAGRCSMGRWPAAEAALPKLAPGAAAKGEDVLLTVVDPSVLAVRCTAAEKDLPALALNQAATGQAACCPNQALALRLCSFCIAPQGPGQYEVRFLMDAPAPAPLLPGMSCTVRLAVYENKSALTASSALLAASSPSEATVQVRAANGTIEKRTVRTGRSHAGRTEILSGLDEGATLVAP